jgi:hypothetical protein
VWPIVGVWPGQPVGVPNVVVLHDDIGAFVSVFGRFPAMNRLNSLLLNQWKWQIFCLVLKKELQMLR